MAVVTPVFFDTTVLVAGLIDLGAAAAHAQLIFDALAARRVRRPQTAWHCCLEFYSVSTRLPPEWRLSAHDALGLLQSEVLGRFEVHQLPQDAIGSFLQTVADEGLVGGRIYDAYIAEIARLAGARTVVTDNRRHFGTLLRHGVRVLNTAEFATQMRH